MITFCKTCLMPDSRPRISFDSEGVCNACRNAERKLAIDWDQRRTEFLALLDESRLTSATYDCVVPWSGGKDSSSIAHKLKYEYGLNPLLVTFSPLVPNECGVHNREELLKLGFDSIMVRPNQRVARALARRFFIERGNPKVAWDAGVNSAPMQAALQMGIPLVVYAEHGESEYGGLVLSEKSMRERDFTEVIEHQIGDFPENWENTEISHKDLAPYIYPDPQDVQKQGIKAIYFAYFFKWSMLENYQYIEKIMPNFQTDPKGRTGGTFTNFDSLDDKIDNLYYYMQYIKFGFGRATRDACRMIQNDQMSRMKGLELARQYDNEFPSTHFKETLNYLEISEADFESIVNLHRNQEVWFEGDSGWELRHPPI